MPRNTATLIRDKLAIWADNPSILQNNIKQLTGRPGYRLRVGDWIYTQHDDILEIQVIDIGVRGGIYQ